MLIYGDRLGKWLPDVNHQGGEGIDHKGAWGLGVIEMFYILIMGQQRGLHLSELIEHLKWLNY